VARTVAATGLTVADVERIPYDGPRRDLIDGRLVVTPLPFTPHQLVATRLLRQLLAWIEVHGGEVLAGPVGLRIADDSLLGPDLVLVLEQHLERIGERWFTEPPDIVVEISSPSTRRDDLGRKRELYAEFGVPEYWFVDLDDEAVLTHRRGSDDRYPQPHRFERGDALTSELLPGFTLRVDTLLERG
jgi:Uma2 family endonuclease